MREDGEIGVEHDIRLADWDRDGKPVVRRRDGRRAQAILAEPGVDRVDGFLSRRIERVDLARPIDRMRSHDITCLIDPCAHSPPPWKGAGRSLRSTACSRRTTLR